jgi:hypothetical protein
LRYGSDNEEYQRGFREGYSEGVEDGYQEGYDRRYRYSYDRAYSLGAAQAQVPNLQDTVDQAYQQGFSKAHDEAFAQAQAAAHQQAYAPAFEAAYSKTYAELYPQFEARHYQLIEQAAYEALYQPPYQSAFTVEEAATFQQSYPKEAKLAYDQGWKAEARDFVDRPVRLLQAWLTPSDVEGMQMLSVKLRNFSPGPVAGSRIRVSFGDQTSRLYHTLPPHCEMTVTGLIRLRGATPERAELFAVLESNGHRIPLGTVTVESAP